MNKFCKLVMCCLMMLPVQAQVKFISFDDQPQRSTAAPCVLLMRALNHWGGVEMHTLALYKTLYSLGYNVRILVREGSKIQSELINANLPHYVICMKKDEFLQTKGTTLQALLASAIDEVCTREKIDVVHTNKALELRAALELKAKFNFAIVVQHHSYEHPTNMDQIRCADAFLSTSPNVIKDIKNENTHCNLGIKNIEFIPPMTLDNHFLNFSPTYRSKQTFFKKSFGFDIGALPIVCMIAHLDACKNHELLLKAAHILITELDTPFHVVLAGTDSDSPGRKDELVAMVAKLGLKKYVHFLGFVDKIAELLYHSDIKVLPSTGEAFAIAVLEAAIMAKPIILSRASGAADQIVFHKKTGLLFDSTNAMELALDIKMLVDDKAFARKLGLQARALVTEKFSEVAIAKRYMSAYDNVYWQKQAKEELSKYKQ
ncbi:MAG: glycosyltransferase family 4 protein [Candidatus Babeliales bacterium]